MEWTSSEIAIPFHIGIRIIGIEIIAVDNIVICIQLLQSIDFLFTYATVNIINGYEKK
jgi:hypothetical protein